MDAAEFCYTVACYFNAAAARHIRVFHFFILVKLLEVVSALKNLRVRVNTQLKRCWLLSEGFI